MFLILEFEIKKYLSLNSINFRPPFNILSIVTLSHAKYICICVNGKIINY